MNGADNAVAERLERGVRGHLQADQFNGGVALGWRKGWRPALRVDDGVTWGTEQGTEQGAEDGVAVDIVRTVCLENILARCCGATTGIAQQGIIMGLTSNAPATEAAKYRLVGELESLAKKS